MQAYYYFFMRLYQPSAPAFSLKLSGERVPGWNAASDPSVCGGASALRAVPESALGLGRELAGREIAWVEPGRVPRLWRESRGLRGE